MTIVSIFKCRGSLAFTLKDHRMFRGLESVTAYYAINRLESPVGTRRGAVLTGSREEATVKG